LLFGALSFLALLSLFLAVEPFDAGAQWGIKVDIIYSLLLLAGMTRFYSGLRNFLRGETVKRQALDKWESQVKEQWVELMKANEKLRQTVSRLETEIAERKQAQEEGEKKLQALLAASRPNEQATPPAATGPQAEAVEQKPAPTPEPAEKNGEPTLTAPHKNGGESQPVIAAFDTEIVAQQPEPESAEPEPAEPELAEPEAVEPEPVEQNSEPLQTASHQNGGEPLPVVAGFDSPIIVQKPEPEPVETNGEHSLTAPRKTREESWPTVCVPNRKINGRKPAGARRKKPAKTRSASRR